MEKESNRGQKKRRKRDKAEGQMTEAMKAARKVCARIYNYLF